MATTIWAGLVCITTLLTLEFSSAHRVPPQRPRPQHGSPEPRAGGGRQDSSGSSDPIHGQRACGAPDYGYPIPGYGRGHCQGTCCGSPGSDAGGTPIDPGCGVAGDQLPVGAGGFGGGWVGGGQYVTYDGGFGFPTYSGGGWGGGVGGVIMPAFGFVPIGSPVFYPPPPGYTFPPGGSGDTDEHGHYSTCGGGGGSTDNHYRRHAPVSNHSSHRSKPPTSKNVAHSRSGQATAAMAPRSS